MTTTKTDDTEIFDKARDKLKKLHLNSNFIETIKTFSLLSLPHTSIIFIYFIYILFGAAIIQEVEVVSLKSAGDAIKSDLDTQIRNQHNQQNFLLILDKYEKNILESIRNKMTDDLSSDDIDQDDERLDMETLTLVTKLMRVEQKVDANSDEFYRKLIKHFVKYKEKLKSNFNSNIMQVLNNEKLIVTRLIETSALPPSLTNESMSTENIKDNIWSFRKSLYFVGTLLTTIGYGDIAPQTKLGKLFTIIYALIGIPLTLILLTDIGCIFTRFLKFIRIFYLQLQTKKQTVNQMPSSSSSPFRFFLFPFRKADKPRSPTDTKSKYAYCENNDIGKIDLSSTSIDSLESFIDVAVECLDKTDDKFDFSLTVTTVLIFLYLTFGAILYSNFAGWSLFDGYYYCFITLSLVGFGDLVVPDETFWLMTTWYTFVGLAFFMLVLQSFHNYLKTFLINNGKRIVCESVKFASKLGYKFDIDDYVDEDEYLIKANLSLVQQQAGIDSSPTYLNDDVFINSEYLRQQQVLLQQRNNLRRRSSLFYKRTGILNDLNELNSKTSKKTEVIKMDKQTQITTMLCSTFTANGTKCPNSLTNINQTKQNKTGRMIETIKEPLRRPSAILEDSEDIVDDECDSLREKKDENSNDLITKPDSSDKKPFINPESSCRVKTPIKKLDTPSLFGKLTVDTTEEKASTPTPDGLHNQKQSHLVQLKPIIKTPKESDNKLKTAISTSSVASSSGSVKSLSTSLTSHQKPLAPILGQTKSLSLPNEPQSNKQLIQHSQQSTKTASVQKPAAPSSPQILYSTKI